MSVMKIFSDPHLGVNRQAHTTIESRALMQAKASARFAKVAELSTDLVVCAGDLFDGNKVSNEVLLNTFDALKNVDLVVGGNHDMSNSSKDTTSFDLLSKFSDPLLGNNVGMVTAERYLDNGCSIVAVPHHSSQELFLETLKDLWEGEPANALILHCTYDFQLETSDTALNLTPEMAERLLEKFKRIFIGHEHAPSTHLDDRVVMVGSTMPFTMGEIADRFVWQYDLETDELTKECIWSAADHYRGIVYEPGMESVLDDKVEFVDLRGNTQAEGGPELSAWVAALWQANPNLLMVRNQVQVGEMEGTQTGTKEAVLTDLKSTIEEELEGSDLKPVWDMYKEEA